MGLAGMADLFLLFVILAQRSRALLSTFSLTILVAGEWHDQLLTLGGSAAG
jgi:hypothetical protein